MEHSVKEATRELLRQNAQMERAWGVLRHERRIAEAQWGKTRDTTGDDGGRLAEDVQQIFYWLYWL
jgi:hypothetical protein